MTGALFRSAKAELIFLPRSANTIAYGDDECGMASQKIGRLNLCCRVYMTKFTCQVSCELLFLLTNGLCQVRKKAF
jgi:hypothetical protein